MEDSPFIILLWPLMLLLWPLRIMAWIAMLFIPDSGPISRFVKRFAWMRMITYQIGHFAWYGEIEWDRVSFNRRRWLAHPHPTSTDTTRAEMLSDLLHYLQEGMTENYVLSPREPDVRVSSDKVYGGEPLVSVEFQFQYHLGRDRTGFWCHLIIDFNSEGRVDSAYGSGNDSETDSF